MSGDNATPVRSKTPWLVFVVPAAIGLVGLRLAREAGTLGWIVVVLAALWAARTAVLCLANSILVSNGRLTARSGFITTRSIDLPLSSLESIHVARGPLGWLLNYGDVAIQGTGGTRSDVYMVGAPARLRTDILRLAGHNDSSEAARNAGTRSTNTAVHPGARHVEFCAGAMLEPHRAFFAGLPDEQQPAVPGLAEATETWQVAAEWDASHGVGTRKNPDAVVRPKLVQWSRDGTKLYVACDATSLSVWTDWGSLVGSSHSPGQLGVPIRCFPAPDGQFVLHEVMTDSGRFSIHSGSAAHLATGSGSSWWGSDQISSFGFNRTRDFSPWRQESSGAQIAVADFGSSVLRVVDIRSLPRVSRGDALRKAPAIHHLRFDGFGAQDERIWRFEWHPSGEYLAVNTGHSERARPSRIHVVHLASAQIVATIPGDCFLLGWSPSGRYLLLQHWTGAYTKSWSTAIHLWDGATFEARPANGAPILKQAWAMRLLFTGIGVGSAAMSCDGARILADSLPTLDDPRPASAPGRPWERGLYVTAARRDTYTVGFGARLAAPSKEEVAHAAWSPVDPHCFVTVGGERTDTLLRIWRLRN